MGYLSIRGLVTSEVVFLIDRGSLLPTPVLLLSSGDTAVTTGYYGERPFLLSRCDEGNTCFYLSIRGRVTFGMGVA